MTLGTRAALIICGIIVFLTLAPLTIFLARGYTFDPKNFRLVKTGAIVIKTEPRGASVFLNQQKVKDTTPLIKRFTPPGEYQIEIVKPDYLSWKKSIIVREQAVTYLPSSATEKIHLLTKSSPSQQLSTTTTDFVIKGDDLYLLENHQIYQMLPDGKQKTVFATTTLNFLDKEILRISEPSQDLYFITEDSKLFLKRRDTGEPQLIINDLPKASSSQIIASPTKQLFLILDDVLFQVSNNLVRINNPIKYASWDNNYQALIYGNDHEIWIYFENQNYLVTRSSQILGQAQYNSEIGYVFVAENMLLRAIEFDLLGDPNTYVIATSKNPYPKFAMDPEGKYLVYLDGQELVSIKIR